MSVSLFDNTRINTVFDYSHCNRTIFNFSTLIKTPYGHTEHALVNMYNNFGKDLEILEKDYALGNFIEISHKFTFNEYAILSEAFYSSEYTLSEGYTKLYNLLSLSLIGLFKSVSQHKCDLKTIQDLTEQINNLKDTDAKISGIGSQSTQFGRIGTIRPEVYEYILEYGMPKDGVFDVYSLGEIMKKLNEAEINEEA